MQFLAVLMIGSLLFPSIFENNVGRNGIVSIGYAPVSFYGRNMFMGNRGTSSLRLIDQRKQNIEVIVVDNICVKYIDNWLSCGYVWVRRVLKQ